MRGATWMHALTVGIPVPGYGSTLQVVDAVFAGQPARYIAVVPDAENRFSRACNGEAGLTEGQQLARAVRDAMYTDVGQEERRAIVVVIDVASRAYDRRGEAYGVHLTLVVTADAYAAARLASHPVIGLIIGRAMSDILLTHGYQASRLLALDDADVMMHAMGKTVVACITPHFVTDLGRLAQETPSMACDVASFVSLGLLWKLLKVKSTDVPDAGDVDTVQTALVAVLTDVTANPSRSLGSRLDASLCSASLEVCKHLREQWNAQPKDA